MAKTMTMEEHDNMKNSGRTNYTQFTCMVCGAKSEMYKADAEEISGGLPPGWEFLYDFAVCAAHFNLIAGTIRAALCEVVERLRSASESKTNALQSWAFIHAAFLIVLDREETKLHDFAEELYNRKTMGKEG